MLQRKYQPLTNDINTLEEMLDCLDRSCEPTSTTPQEQIIYWQTTKQNDEMKRSVKK